MAVSQPDYLTIECPDCGAEMKVDVATGKVLSHRAQKRAESRDFDSLLAGIDDSKNRADEIFRREVAALDQKDRLMEEKFRDALRRVEEEEDPAEPPKRPWDFE